MPRHERRALEPGETLSPLLQPLAVQSVADRVYRELLEAILTGKFTQGQVLRQEFLARQLGVSRTPLREALMRLASEGLVQLEANRSASVTGLDFGDMQHAWRSRLVLEPGAARIAAERRDGASLHRMRLAVERQRRTADDIEESLIANREFHLALVRGSGNPYLIRFSEMLWTFQIAVPIFGRQADDPAEVLIWADDHQMILEAVDAGDGDRAEDLTRQHIAAYPPRTP